MLAAATWGLAIVGFGFSHTLWLALLCLAIAGGADGISGIFRMTMWNETIPDTLRGRLASIEMVSYMSGPLLGHLEAGAVAAVFGVAASIVSGGALCVAAVLACGVWLPRFVRYDARRFKVLASERDSSSPC
jgi:MFS family permease